MKIKTFEERISAQPNGCWIWTGSKTKAGYGRFWNGGRHVYAHREAYRRWKHPPDPKLKVCHNCPSGDNPSCVNPAHLFIGTDKENMEDAVKKGRTARGDRQGSRKHPETRPRGDNHWTHRMPERMTQNKKKMEAMGL